MCIWSCCLYSTSKLLPQTVFCQHWSDSTIPPPPVNRYVIAPYHQFSNLLDVLFNLLKTEQTRGIRREVIRVLGLLGALDPYKKQLQEARTKRSKMGTPHSKPLNSKKEGWFVYLILLLGPHDCETVSLFVDISSSFVCVTSL